MPAAVPPPPAPLLPPAWPLLLEQIERSLATVLTQIPAPVAPDSEPPRVQGLIAQLDRQRQGLADSLSQAGDLITSIEEELASTEAALARWLEEATQSRQRLAERSSGAVS